MTAVRGWCPSAYSPMMSGDGLLVRVRPRMARLSAAQADYLADLAERYGNGLIDLTSRGNLQIRGVEEAHYPSLLQDLIEANLVAADPTQEISLTVTPFPDAKGETAALVQAIEAAASDLPRLPDKMGVVVDTGASCWLTGTSGDFRFERVDKGIILRADGAAMGRPVTVETAASALLEMAHWFVETGGAVSGRMRRHLAATALPDAWSVRSAEDRRAPPLPDVSKGHLGVAFGQLSSAALRKLIAMSGASTLVFTPWRSVLIADVATAEAQISVGKSTGSSAQPDASAGDDAICAAEGSPFIAVETDPRLKVVACPGAPRCRQASIETRQLATRLAPFAQDVLHVSGCAKGCARPISAPVVVVGRDGVFDLVLDGKAQDDPIMTGLGEGDVIAYLTKQAKGEQTGSATNEGSRA